MLRFRTILTSLALIMAFLPAASIFGEEGTMTREEKVRADRAKALATGYWRYNDLENGLAEARKTNKPVIVVLRCIPCEECVKLDEELMESDPVLRPLLDQFVRVRIVGTNGLDLNVFQYDYDQSFAVFLMNADKTIYGRFGTRSHRTDWTKDVSIQGLAKAMNATLYLHERYPENKNLFAGKQGEKPLFPAPEKFPALKDKFTSELNYEGDIVKSCIHCHQIGDAQKSFFRDQAKPIPAEYLFPYPHPKAIGMIFDPSEMSTLSSVVEGSKADQAGLQAGDRVHELNGQIILSIADVQWVLHHADDQDSLPVVIRRGEETLRKSLVLDDNWRSQDDLSWRVSSWPMRRMVTGGMVLEEASPSDRQQAGIGATEMALRVKYVGRYGPHAAAKNAGFKVGDIIVAYDGHDDLVRETDLLAYGARNLMPGKRVSVQLIRGNRPLTLQIPMQK